MKKMIALLLAGMAVSECAAELTWNVNVAIPDNDPMGLQDTRLVSDFAGDIATIEVWLLLSGDPMAYNGDYYVTLQHDSGFAVLLNRTGRTAGNLLGYGENGLDVTFVVGGNDIHQYQNFTPSYDGQGRLTGTWGVDGRAADPDLVLDTSPRTDMLADFVGMNPNGNWTIFVADVNQNANANFDSWGLNITTVPEPATLGLLAVSGLVLLLRRRWMA